MDSQHSIRINNLIARLAADENAREELITITYDRLRALAAKIFHEDFPRLCNDHETASVLNEALARLLKALQSVELPAADDYFRFSAQMIRRVLIDLARRRQRLTARNVHGQADDDSRTPAENELAESQDTPDRLAMWAEFHEKIDEMPTDEKDIVDLHLYHGLPQAEIAELLQLHPKEVSRRWLRARQKFMDWDPEA